MADLRKVLASNMKQYRKKMGLSQAKLAEMVDTADNYIALIETSKRFPSINTLNTLERIAGALNIDSLELFSLNPVKSLKKTAVKAKKFSRY